MLLSHEPPPRVQSRRAHSIVLSARNKRLVGMLSPSAFAVFRLMTS